VSKKSAKLKAAKFLRNGLGSKIFLNLSANKIGKEKAYRAFKNFLRTSEL